MTNELTVMEQNEQLVVNSVEVAEMTGKEHKNLMRDIRGYIEILEVGSNLSAPNFFVEGTYVSSQNKIMPCYYLTRKGCDMVANKMTGKKGIQFTAVYVEKFYEMENHIKLEVQPKVPQTFKEALIAMIALEDEKELLLLENKQHKEVIEEQKPLVTFAEKISYKSTSLNN